MPDPGRGRSRRLWPWVLALVLAAAAVWLAVAITSRRGPPVPDEPAVERLGPREVMEDTAPRPPVPAAAAGAVMDRVEEMRAAVRRYEERCAGQLEPAAGPGLGALVAGCVDRLSAAIDAVVASDTVGQLAIDERLDRHDEQVSRLRSLAPGGERAAATREVLRSAAEVLAVVAEERYPRTLAEDTAALGRLKSAAAAVEPDRPLARQQERIQRFFVAAGGVLNAMARPDAGLLEEP